jgi:tetrahydromethanopterin S-methyltransferase subunit G
MLTDEQFLPIDIQESIKELRAGGVNERTLAGLTDRILRASEAKTTSLQMDIDRIETSINRRLDRIGDKVEADLQTRLGSSNQMIVDIYTAVQSQGAAVTGLRAEFQTFGETVSGRLSGVEGRMDASEADRRQMHEQNARLEQKFDRLETEVRQALDRALGPARVAELIEMIERHERILGGATEAGT